MNASSITSAVRLESRTKELRRRLILAALFVSVLGLLHHLDHVVRGYIVVTDGLPNEWNHSGWPFWNGVTLFTGSLVIVYAILLGGIALTLRRRAWAGYWLGAAGVLFATVAFVHFLGPQAETPSVIWRTHGGGVAGVLALLDLFLVLGALIALALQAIDVRRKSGRWREEDGGGRRG